MAFPVASNTEIFSSDQQIAFKAYYWDTTATPVRIGRGHDEADRLTAFGTGIEFGMFDLYPTSFAPTTRAEIEAALTKNDTSPVTSSVLGYSGTNLYRTGVTPVLYSYWGAGSPPGGSRAAQVLLKYAGYVRTAGEVSLVFAGQGTVAAYVTKAVGGSVETILAPSRIKEPDPTLDASVVSGAAITNEWGYQYATKTFAVGDYVEIYYWHNGEPWGGIAAKVVSGALAADRNFLKKVREAPVLGTSFMAKDKTVLEATQIPYLIRARLDASAGEVAEMELEVALTTSGEEEGFRLDVLLENNTLRDLQSAFVLKKGRILHFEGGFLTPTGGEEMYPRFTGVIDDIFPSSDGTSATIRCVGIESRLTNVNDENTPDRLDYHANGYVLRQRSAEPVFGIPAFDNWPLEIAVATLATKAGIDSFTLGYSIAAPTANYGRFLYREATSGADYFGSRLFAARSLADPSKMVTLARQTNYGNVPPLQKDYLLPDDEYLLKPEVTQRLYDRVRAITDQYGYDFFGNAEGQLVLAGRNNAIYFQYLTQNGLYTTGLTPGQGQVVHVNAVGGIAFAQKDSAGPWSRIIEGRFARVDLYAGIGVHADSLNGGVVNVLVEAKSGSSWTAVLNTSFDTAVANEEAYYYDDVVRTDGTSATVFRLFSLPLDYYRVTLSPGGPSDGQADCWYRLNGAAIYERDPEQSYYTKNGAPVAFSTLANSIKIEPQSNYKDLRNHVVVVGSRKAAITDSAKVGASTDANQEYEFNIAVAVDPASMYDPESNNFVGSKRMTVVFDDKVSDSAFARWIASTILNRYRQPKATAKLTHTVVPALEARDALYVVEAQNRSVDGLLWVTKFSETWEMDEATTDIELSGYPEIASYQPREDIDVDTLFVDPQDGRGEPAINVALAYKNLYGQVVGNADLSAVSTVHEFVTRARGTNAPMFSEAISNADSITLSKPAIPETMYLSMNVSHANNDAPVSIHGIKAGYRVSRKRVLVNNPYRHFFTIPSWGAGNLPTVDFTFHEGDGTQGVYDKAYYNFPTGNPTTDTPTDADLATDQWYLCYDYLLPRTGRNPFYDPYTSELGNFVSVSFDLLVSGRVRVSVWDANQSAGYEVPVAWLTEPGADAEEPEQHWMWMDAGEGKKFSWDGVDNIGFWNTLQSGDWAEFMKGSFGDKPVAVGGGFYAWNDKSTNRHTLIGDTDAANFDVEGAPYFTIGQFGRFYVKIEVLNDDLIQADIAATGSAEPRTVNSNALPASWNATSEAYVWTHLGEPTQVAMRIQDWSGTGDWTPDRVTTEEDWSAYSTPNADASFFEGAPVRVTFVPRARRGKLWEKSGDRSLDVDRIGVKLTRQVKLKATMFDQQWQLSGRTWQDMHSSYVVGGAEQKRLANRMYHNEEHALEWEDGSWRTGLGIRSYEWVFDPTMFKKDWGTGQKESLRYGDYEQLESLPGFDGKDLGGTSVGTRAYMMLAYINYLFYISAFCMDRSGRRQWCLNSWADEMGAKQGFIDKSKIVSNEWRGATPVTMPYAVVDYEARGAETYLVKSVFVRQWKEDYWTLSSDVRSPVSQYSITNPHQLALVQPKVADLNPRRKVFMSQVNADQDQWLRAYGVEASHVNRILYRHGFPGLGKNWTRTLDLDTGSLFYEETFYMLPRSFGTWNWDRPTVEGYFTPNPCRDFHPYWKYPFMPDAAQKYLYYYTRDRQANALDVLSCATSQSVYSLRDPAAKEIWYGFAYADSYARNHAATNAGAGEEEKNYYFGARLERSVEEEGATEGNYRTGEIVNLFDYSREDNLDRFDQFRGVLSRSTYADRTAHEQVDYTDSGKQRAGSVQPVRPSGVNLLNLGRYDFYTLAPVHNDKSLSDLLSHFVDTVEDWFDIRFRHEYVWYSDRYFPVTQYGGAVYGYTRNEYTKALEWVGAPWWATRNESNYADPTVRYAKPNSVKYTQYNLSTLHFDPGAWPGWKDDVWETSVPGYAKAEQWQAWSTAPYLRWQEIGTVTRRHVSEGGKTDNACGGFTTAYTADPTKLTGMATARVAWLHADATSDKSVTRRQNLFDEHYAQMRRARLAVGPELPESVGIILNLSLPARLRG